MDNSQALIESAKKYYDYLEQNNKGIISYSVKYVEKLSFAKNGFFYRIKINSKLNYLDELQLQVFDKIYKKHLSKIEMYDEENKTVIMQVSSEIINEISDLTLINPENIKIVYDLKFLIKNVQKLFETNPLQQPSAPTILNSEDDVKIFNDCSQEQIKAVKTALTKPISYVWGAPGTGKTQYVLTNAVLNYTVKNKKVIIVAPTNNAIEQVMASLIKVTDQVGVPRNRIIRLGTPTKDFFNKYPEVCEKEKLWKVLSMLNGRINILDEVLKYKHKKELFENYYDVVLQELSELGECQTNNSDNISDISDLQNELEQLNRIEESTTLNYDNILAEKKYYIEKLSSIGYEDNNQTLSAERQNCKAITESLHEKEKNILNELSEIRKRKKTLKQEIKVLKQNLQKFSMPNFRKNLKKLKINLDASITDFNEIEEIVKNDLKKISDELNSNSQMYAEYENDSEEIIQSKLDDLIMERMETYQKSTQGRIDSSLIMGMTLDVFVSSRLSFVSFEDSNTKREPLRFNAEHIFLDEAGYSSLEKALSIFTTKQPITLLGDNFQLPPVCELDENMLQQNPELSLWLQSSLYALEFLQGDVNRLANMYVKKQLPNFDKLNKQNLTCTYRFGQNLLDVLSQEVYKIKMKSAPNKDNIEILYIDAPRSSVSVRKRENLDEAEKISKYLFQHLNEDIAILSPYRNQVFELKKKCRVFGKDNVMTIHGSQGQEWETVILSVCDTYDKYFTDSYNPRADGKRILNTAISRVKRKLIIVCDYNYWKNQHNQLISKLLKVANPVSDL